MATLLITPSMSTRSAPMPHPHAITKTSSNGPSSRSSTPTRVHAPRSRGKQHVAPPSVEPTADRQSNRPQRKRNTGRRRADQRSHSQTPVDTPVDGSEPEANTSTDDDLFELLGVPDAKEARNPAPGLLQLSREDMEEATANKKTRRRAKKPTDDTTAGVDSEPRRSRRGKKDANANGDGQSNRGKKGANPDSSLDLSAMSQSLPASFFAEAKPGSKDAQSWDMPQDSPVGGPQQLTVCFSKRSRLTWQWQQQLQAETTPSKGGRRQSKAQPKAGGHDRHASLDNVSVSEINKMMKGAPRHASPPRASASPAQQGSSMPVSAFDGSIPFHTGFNVHRAPQTPMRPGAKAAAASTPGDNTITLPIVGEFPRINKATGVPLGGPKYAGPTFHNSPASGSLPKPDLDDF